MGDVAGLLVQDLWSSKGQNSAREAYRRILKLPSPGGIFYHVVLSLELNSKEDTLSKKEITAVFEVSPSETVSTPIRILKSSTRVLSVCKEIW